MNTKRNQLSTKMVYQGVPESGVPELAAPVYMYKLTGLYTYGMRNAAMPFLNPYVCRFLIHISQNNAYCKALCRSQGSDLCQVVWQNKCTHVNVGEICDGARAHPRRVPQELC